LAIYLGSVLAFCVCANAQLVRKDFDSLGAAEIASLRTAFAAMMALDAGKVMDSADGGKNAINKDLNRLGWRYQGFIHGVPEYRNNMGETKSYVVTGAPANAAWDSAVLDSCEHSTWFFLSWHRMELHFFEKIVQAMAGNNNVTVPYWNFGKGGGAKLPSAFRNPANATNALWWPNRNAGVNDPNDANATALPAEAVKTLDAFSKTAFFTNKFDEGPMSFGGGAGGSRHAPMGAGTGAIENVPHNSVHGAVGNGNAESLSDAGGAGLDPIFWPIHVNIDRAWACWQLNHPGTEPKADAWLKTTKFSFIDIQAGKAMKVEMTGQQIIDYAGKLNYTYGNLDDTCKDFQGTKPKVVISSAEPVRLRESVESERVERPLGASVTTHTVLGSQPVAVSIPLSEATEARMKALVAGDASPGSIVLTVGGLSVERATGASYGIFVELPEGSIPSGESDSYVTELTFFGVGHHRHTDENQDNRRSYDITDVVGQLLRTGRWQGGQLVVTFANSTAWETDRAQLPSAPPEARAHFSYVALTVK